MDKKYKYKYEGICKDCGLFKSLICKSDNNTICRSCYAKKHPRQLKICSLCNQYGKIAKKDNGLLICMKCYERKYRNRIRMQCDECHQIRTLNYHTNGKRLCRTCGMRISGKVYAKRKTEYCIVCNRVKTVAMRQDDSSAVCNNCYEAKKKKEDFSFYLRRRLKTRVQDAFRLYSRTGKIRKSKDYGINYTAIINYLGPPPNNQEDWQIDHIFPLAAFDLSDPKQVVKAFAPENHQWMIAKDNRHKSNLYDVQKFAQYLGEI